MISIYTVTTGKYKYGVFALINSIRSNDIDLPIVVGTDTYLQELNELAGVTQVVIDSDWNGINLKPGLILSNPSEYFIYFDADIILTDPTFINEVKQHITNHKFFACIDGIVAPNEVRRDYWQKIYNNTNYLTNTCWYFNSGFFAGCFDKHKLILKDWQHLNEYYLDPKAYLFSNPKLPMGDQDTFNAILQTLPNEAFCTIQMPDWNAVTITTHPFYHIGNFRPHAFIHCTGKQKPWLINKTPARAPNVYDDLWYKYIIEQTDIIKCNFPLTHLHKHWFKRNYLSRFIIQLKKRFNF